MAQSEGPSPKNKGGRPADPRPLIGNVRVAPEDHLVLLDLERRTALAPDELIRAFVHLTIWEFSDQLPEVLQAALTQAKRQARP